MPNNKYDIHDRIFNFIVEVIEFVNKLPKTYTNIIFIKQITRSVTSMGANDQEADGSLTNKDFIHNFTTVRKEGKETVFWLKIIDRINKIQSINNESEKLIKEGNEIVAIVSTIIKNASLSSNSIK